MIIDGVQLTEGSEISNATIASGLDFPQDPSVGELFFNTTLGLLHVYDGTNWVAVGGGGTGGSGGPFLISGDVSGVIDGGVDALTLRSVNATPVTLKLQRVTTNAKGLVTETTDATSQDIIDALGYTPANGSAAGATGEVQYNGGSGALAASTRFSWSNASNTLTIGAIGADATIAAPEELSLVVAGNTALNIDASGVWRLGASPGVSGNVLTSTGTGAPVWANVNGLLAGTPVVTSQSIAFQGDITVTPTPYGNGNISPVATLIDRLMAPASGFFRLDINSKGLVVGTSAVQPSDVITAFGYTPANVAGDTFTGPVYLSQAPQAGLEAATKAYVDAVAQGVAVKASARVATTGNIALTGIQTIDGVLLQVGDRVVVKNQTDIQDNGVYEVGAGAWSRTTDADASDELEGAFVFVSEGTINASTGWFQSTPAPITVGTTDIVWSQFSGAGAYSAGAGLTLTGGEFSLTNAGTPLSAFFGQITTNTKGQVVSTQPATQSDIITALGYTPINVGGLDRQVQFNDNGVLGGSTGLTLVDNKLAVNDTFTSTAGAAHLTVTPASPTQELRLTAGNAPENTTATGGDVILSGGAHGGMPVAGSFGPNPENPLETIFFPPAPLESGNVIIQGGTTPGPVNIGSEESPSYAYMPYFSTGDVTIRTRPAGGSNGVTGIIRLQTADIDRLVINSDGTINVDTARLTINSDEWYIGGSPGLPGQVLASTGSTTSPAWIDAGAGTVTSVSGSGGTTGLSLTGGPITNIGTLTIGGTLNVANGGTGATTRGQAATNILPIQTGNTGWILATDGTTASWEDPATIIGSVGGSGTVTSIDISGGTTGLTTSGGPITSTGTITLAGTLAIGSGGTGQATRAAAINALLPTQTGNSGKYLLTNGNDVNWSTLTASGAAGATGNFQYNQGGSFAAFTELAFDDGTSTLTVGTGGVGVVEAGSVTSGGTLTLSADNAIDFSVDGAERLRISNLGALRFDATYGTAGQILTSHGSAAAATWEDPPTAPNPYGDVGAVQYNNGGVFDGANGVKIVSGTRLNVTGIVDAGELNTSGRIFLDTNGTIETDYSLDLGIGAGNFNPGSGSGGDGGNVTISAGSGSDPGNSGGSVTISAGQGAGDASGGSIILRAASGSGAGSNGIFQVRTSPPGAGVGTVNRLTINEYGAWFVDASNTPGGASQALITDSNGIPLWRDIPTGAPAGTPGQLQWNNTGAVDGSAQMSYNGTDTLTVGLATGTFNFLGQNGTTAGGAISLTAGTSTSAGGLGGALNLSAGAASTVGATGGTVTISSGTGVSSAFGPLILRTGTTERLRILGNGSWSVGSAGTNVGTSGQVLTSGGTGVAPTWANVGSATGILGGAVNQIPYQSGVGVTAFSANFTWTNGTSTLGLGSGSTIITPNGAGNAAGGALAIRTGGSGNAGNGGALTISTGTPAAAGTTNGCGPLTIHTGDIGGGAFGAMTPGLLTIRGSDSAGNGGTGGSVLIRSGAHTNNGAAGNLTLTASTGVTSNGYLAINTGGSERLRFNPNGSWGLAGAANYGTSGFVLTSNGNAAPTWGAVSDERLKENIVDAPSALDKVRAMQVRSYDWKESGEHVEHGFVAQELHLAEPAAVAMGDTWTIEPAKIVPVLTKALQEALLKIEQLEQRLAAIGL